ncbi:hypothetical protein [Vibrio astriarenae]|uniref:hypothetical protein n=1 Tax=Vibrio astriarenae TaxID=1481923 RepID=UPI0037361CEC
MLSIRLPTKLAAIMVVTLRLLYPIFSFPRYQPITHVATHILSDELILPETLNLTNHNNATLTFFVPLAP